MKRPGHPSCAACHARSTAWRDASTPCSSSSAVSPPTPRTSCAHRSPRCGCDSSGRANSHRPIADGAIDRLEAADAELDRLETLIEGLLVLSRAEGSGVAAVDVDLGRRRRSVASSSGTRSPPRPARPSPTTVPRRSRCSLCHPPSSRSSTTSSTTRSGSAAPKCPSGSSATSCTCSTAVRACLPTSAAHAFERFWRGRGEQDRRGSGLGLAIVAQLAGASGATAELAAREGGGLDAIVEFRVR